jgi:hypothetical protein
MLRGKELMGVAKVTVDFEVLVARLAVEVAP